MSDPKEPIAILIAEDNPGDRTLIENSFKETGIKSRLFFAEDGQELINYMNEAIVYSDLNKSSCLVLMDLKMPRLDGARTLKIIKTDQRFKQIPVVVFSSSSLDKDVNDSYQLGANSYFTKPSDYKGFLDFAKLLKKYWLEKAILPA